MMMIMTLMIIVRRMVHFLGGLYFFNISPDLDKTKFLGLECELLQVS